jgi:hypothetical protein
VKRERRPYTVRLAAFDAPWVRARTVRARDFAEASVLCRTYITENDLGASDWAGGDVRDHTGARVARVSYNGRVWPPGDWQPGIAPLWEAS